MASVKIIQRLDKSNSKGEAPLYMRITKDRITKTIALKVYVLTKHWNQSSETVKAGHPNSARVNNFLSKKLSDAKGMVLDLETKSKTVNTAKFKETIMGKPSENFFHFADKVIRTFEQSGKIGTLDRYKAVLAKMKTYQKTDDLQFEDITVAYLKKYEAYLKGELGNCHNTVLANFKVIRKILKDAIAEDIITIDKNPFLKMKMSEKKVQREFLTEDELQRLEIISLIKGSKKDIHRDMYVFASYVGGIRVSDLLQLKFSDINGDNILFTIKKTGNQISILMPEKAKAIIEKYRSDNLSGFIFPVKRNNMDNSTPRSLDKFISSATAYLNKDLKSMAKLATIEKRITMHTSRHTWATRALSKGMRIEHVSKLMGHSNLKETQIYAKVMNLDLEKAMEVFNS